MRPGTTPGSYRLLAKNLFNFIAPFIQDGALALDWDDEVIAGSCLTHDGELRHAGVRQALGLISEQEVA